MATPFITISSGSGETQPSPIPQVLQELDVQQAHPANGTGQYVGKKKRADMQGLF